MYSEAATARPLRLAPSTPQHCPEGNVGRYPSVMSGAIASLLGAHVGGLATIGGAWLQARGTARLQREEAARREEHRQAERTALFQDRRRILARRYLFQLTTAWLSPKQSWTVPVTSSGF
jgi:hypothetical protein